MTKNILIAAVGGQGALLAARVLGSYASNKLLQVKVSEIHGMSQRGGSVVTHVRFGKEVHSPVIEAGTADVVLAFELLEAARYVFMLRRGGMLLVNTQQILPLPVLTGAADYPGDLLGRFGKLPITTVAVDALGAAAAVGNIKAVNTVLLGAYARLNEPDVASWHEAITSSVREAHRAINLAAFDRGYAIETTPTNPRGFEPEHATERGTGP
jgi:indolepyruvate ferredoxin oxidoreductase, beta subunit